MDLRALQRPLKQRYREEPEAARITLRATARLSEPPLRCIVETTGGTFVSEAHPGVGGPGTASCSGDLLLAALAACAQITCQMVATALGIPVEQITVTAEGDVDLRGTLGIARDVPVGFQDVRLRVDLDAPEAAPEQLATLREKTEQFCVIFQTLRQPPAVTVTWSSGEAQP
ncbi:MAG: OsmC family protein [Thermomicrobium sp.]|nr:OsmC family protein [Thermomicrobium sp.]